MVGILGRIRNTGPGVLGRVGDAAQAFTRTDPITGATFGDRLQVLGAGLGDISNLGETNALGAQTQRLDQRRQQLAALRKDEQRRQNVLSALQARAQAGDQTASRLLAAVPVAGVDAAQEAFVTSQLDPEFQLRQQDTLADNTRADRAEQRQQAQFEADQAQQVFDNKITERLTAIKESAPPPGTGGAPSEGERKFATFARLATNAQETLSSLESKEGFDPTRLPIEALSGLRGPDAEQYVSAKRTFIDAIIRPMTGAAVTEFEFNSADRRYFPQIGDNEATVKFKRELRQQAIDAIAAGAGRASGILEGSGAPGAPDASSFQEGQTATNSQTGERMVFRNGEWVPL